MSYKMFPKDDSERSILYNKIYNRNTLFIDPQTINLYLEDELKEKSKKLFADLDVYRSEIDKSFIYLKNNIVQSNGYIDISQINSLTSHYIQPVIELLEQIYKLVFQDSNNVSCEDYDPEDIDPEEFEPIAQMTNDRYIKLFIESLEGNLIPFNSTYELDHEINNIRTRYSTNLGYCTPESIEEYFRFCILQYEVIIREILSSITKDSNTKPQFIQEMIDDGELDVDGKTVIGGLDDLISTLKCHIGKFDYNYIKRNFVQSNGKPWSISTIKQKLSDHKID